MLRTQISLTEAERAALDEAAVRTGQSVAALIREAVDERYLHDPSVDEDLHVLRRGFGAWGERAESSVEYVDGLRSGKRLDAFR